MAHTGFTAQSLCELRYEQLALDPFAAQIECELKRQWLAGETTITFHDDHIQTAAQREECLRNTPCGGVPALPASGIPSAAPLDPQIVEAQAMAVESGFSGVGGATLFGTEETEDARTRFLIGGTSLSQDPVPSVVGVSRDICRNLGVPEWICDLGAAALNNWLAGDSVTPPPPPGGTFVARDCPTGFEPCIFDRSQCCEVGSTVEQILPGGETGRMPAGQVVMGDLGAAVLPRTVGQINGKPILRCPRGSVLSRKNLCYDKRVLPVRFRKWPPAPKPPMSAKDAKMLRRMGTIQDKVKKLAGTAGFSCKKKGSGMRRARPAPTGAHQH